MERLVNDGVITKIQLQTIEEEVQQTGRDIVIALINSQLVSESVIRSYLNNSDVQSIQLGSIAVDIEVARKIPKEVAVSTCVFAFYEKKNEVGIAMSNPSDEETIAYMSEYFDGKPIKPYIAKETDILSAIDKFYEYNFQIGNIIEELEASSGIEYQGSDSSYQSPIIRIVDAILSDAVHKGASDIHIQPDEFFIRVRYRIDGVMQNQFTFHKKFYQSVVVRMKIVGNMNIAESIRPQDGAIKMTIMGRKIDFRVSLMPTIYGEGIVIRVLDKNDSVSSLARLGLLKDNEEKIRKIISKPEGVLIMTGPTGSGKTTTLYAIISELSNPGINMMTLEDPVEYHMPMAKQMNVNHAADITFASGLRAILRQDPDVILVGEMRDEETAITAMRAAMTGHKVFSTLHTNDAVSAINRLLDLQVSKHIIASSVNGIVAQRLVRRLCQYCKKPRNMTDAEFTKYRLKKKEIVVYDACGCKLCNNIGYKGRIGVTEVLAFDGELRSMISDGLSEHEIYKRIRSSGKFVPMQIDAIRKVISGITSFEEVHRAINMSEYF